VRTIVLAEGLNDNLGPLTLDLPTAALPIAGQPLVSRTLAYLERHGISEAIVSCYRGPHVVREAVERHGGRMPVAVVLEGPPESTPSPLKRLASRIDERFVVVMGDILTDLDLRAAIDQHVRRGSLATVVVTEVDPPCVYGEVATDHDGVVVMIGSEQLILRAGRRIANTGIYIFEPEVLQYISDDHGVDLARDVLPLLVERELPVAASHQRGFWHPITTHDQYRAANVAVLEGAFRGIVPAGEQIATGIWVGSGARVAADATLAPPVLIGAGCRVERDATIGPDAVLCDGVRVERGGVVRRTVVLPGSKVGVATRLEDAVVRGNVLARASIAEPTFVDDREVLETLERSDARLLVRSMVDRVLALLALIAFSPLMLLIALLIKLDSRGPVFYSQLRVGEGRRTTSGQYRGKVFALMKFRTMYQDADRRLAEVLAQNEYGESPFVKIRDDPRITRLGRWLRASSLDELPQLINVLKGEMGLVGNRPLPLYEAEQLDDDWQRIRFNAPAGITGLWQISGRSDLSAEERIILDNYYALTRSLWSDLRILLVTIPVLLARRGAR